jgi:ABC transporter substrate binding protein
VTVLRGAAEKLGIMLQAQAVSDPDRFTGAFATMVAQRAQALVVVIDPLTVRYRDLIVELAMNNRLPAMYGFREFADAGGLIAYGVNLPHLCRRAAVYVDKIIKGAKPADLPIEQPTRFELVINLKTARALGLEIPPILIARADEVIEWGRREALQHQQLSPLPMRRHPRRRARHDSEKRPTKLELVVNLRTGKGPRCRGAHRNSLARRRGNRVKYIMSVVGSAPRRRESSVEEDSTRRVVD